MAAANAFLEQYLPQYDRRFAVPAAQAADLHRPLPAGLKLEQVLGVKTRRALRRDGTVVHHGQLYQVETAVQATHVLVKDSLDGTRHLTHQGWLLRYHAIAARPAKTTGAERLPSVRRVVKPRQIIHGTNRRWRVTTRRRESHDKEDISTVGSKRTFLFWLDTCRIVP